MRPSKGVTCSGFPCLDVKQECFVVLGVDVKPETVKIVLVSEAAPPDVADSYYAGGTPLFARTTLQAFADAGTAVETVRDLLDLGLYLTTAVKCGKTGYGIAAATVDQCSRLLEKELALFPNTRALLAMGDVAIKALNCIAKRSGEARVVPAGSTYRIRGQILSWRGMRVFPSYLQAGPSFFIEKSKRRMIAEDIAAALRAAG
jgi:uracil-DNA glycosylase